MAQKAYFSGWRSGIIGPQAADRPGRHCVIVEKLKDAPYDPVDLYKSQGYEIEERLPGDTFGPETHLVMSVPQEEWDAFQAEQARKSSEIVGLEEPEIDNAIARTDRSLTQNKRLVTRDIKGYAAEAVAEAEKREKTVAAQEGV